MKHLGFIGLVIVLAVVIGMLLCCGPGQEIETPYTPEPVIETEVIAESLPDIEAEETVPVQFIPVTPEVIDSLIESWGEEEYEEIAPDISIEEIIENPDTLTAFLAGLNDLRHAEYDTTIVDTVLVDAENDSVYIDSLNIHVDVSWFPLNENARIKVDLSSRSKIREQMTITQPVLEEPKQTWHFETGLYFGRFGGATSMALYSCVYHDRFPLGIGFIGTAETVLIGINVRLK